MNDPFEEKTVVITGAARGIGRAVAEAYSRQGANVIIADIKEKEGKETERLLVEKGARARFLPCDISIPEEAIDLMFQAYQEFGQIDILINNAGKSFLKPILNLSVDEWDQVMNVNLRGAFICAREAAKYMKMGGGGSIVNIASTRACMSEPGWEAYGASKAGLVGLTHALAVSLGADKIKVNAVSPGWIMTGDYQSLRKEDHQQHPAGRVGRPGDIARACLFLTDPANDFITGQNFIIDGGMTRKMIYE